MKTVKLCLITNIMKPKTRIITNGDQFQINSKRYVFLRRWFNTNTKTYNVSYQSLFDNGIITRESEDDFEAKLNLCKSENVSIFGR